MNVVIGILNAKAGLNTLDSESSDERTIRNVFPLINNWSICEAFGGLKTNLKTRGRLLLLRRRLVGPPQQSAPRTVCVSVCSRGRRQLRTGVGGRRRSRERPAAQNTAEEESDGKRDRKGEKVSDRGPSK